MKTFLNDEIPALKESINKSLAMNEISSDPAMTAKANKVIEMLESFAQKNVDREMVTQVLKIQELVSEIEV